MVSKTAFTDVARGNQLNVEEKLLELRNIRS